MRLRSLSLLLACGVTLLTFRTARPAEEKSAPLPLARLIDRLGSSDFAEREGATRALDDIGTAALPDLRRAAEGDDPEIRRRAGDLIRRIERRAEAARLLAPKRVRLSCRDTPVGEALADLTRQSGFAITLPGDTGKVAGRRLTLDTGTVPFWEAFDQFCRKAGVSEPALLPDGQRRASLATNPYGAAAAGQPYLLNPYYPYGVNPADANAGRLILLDGQAPEVPTWYAGAVRIRALPGHVALPAVVLGADERLLPLEVATEPGVSWEGVIALRITRAVDDRGRRLTQPLPFLGQATSESGPAGTVVHIIGSDIQVPQAGPDARHIPVRLRTGPDPAKVVKELEGVVTAQVRTPPEELLRVDNVLEAAGRTVPGPHGGWLKVVEVSRDDGGVVKVHGEIAYPPNEEGPPSWLGPGVAGRQVVFFVRPAVPGPVPAVELRDAQGHPFGRLEAFRGTGPADGGPGDFRITFRPRPGQTAPAQLVYVGRRSVLVDVPFVLRNVPLP